MNYEAPGNYTQDTDYREKGNNLGPSPKKNYYPRSRYPLLSTPPDCSPLLRAQTNYSESTNNGSLNTHNMTAPLIGPQDFRAPIYNRLGRNNNQNRSYDKNETSKDHNNYNNNKTNDNNYNGRNRFNRKRSSDGGSGPSSNPKRRWNNKPYQSNSNTNHNQHNANIAKNRMDRLRSLSNSQVDVNEASDMKDVIIKLENKVVTPVLVDSQDVDATDITVQIVNDGPQKRVEDEQLHRFKMILDSKAQTAIKLIQEKRKEKQVIFPYPVTPNVTKVSLHDRFTSL